MSQIVSGRFGRYPGHRHRRQRGVERPRRAGSEVVEAVGVARCVRLRLRPDKVSGDPFGDMPTPRMPRAEDELKERRVL